MEMKPGYKQTEVGVLPEDWKLVKFRQIVVDNRIPSGVYKSQNLYGHGTKIIKISNVFGYDYFLPDLAQRVELTSEEISKYGVIVGDIIVALASVKLEGVGQVMLVNRLDENTAFDHNVALIRLIKAVNPGYIFYLFKSTIIRNLVGARATQVGTSFLKASTILEFPIPLPSNKAEQEAIAEALSDVDALIESLEQLIAKKRQIKQGTMQELLTGKRRLPGFSGEWKIIHLRDLLLYERPDEYIVQNTNYFDQGEIPVLTANKTFILGYTLENFGICRKFPVIVFDDFTTDCKYVDFPFKVKSSAIKLLRPKHDRVDLRFVFDRIHLINFPLGDHKRYYISEYQNLELTVPDYEEQQAIAAILSDMDAEIAALEEKLGKARQVKQGMMQELLTGRTRLL